MNIVAKLTLNALNVPASLAGYGHALTTACKRKPPPFGEQWYGERYRTVGADPSWLAGSLVANAQKEGDGARKLWILAGRAQNPLVAEKVRRHAIDEARHARLYLRMLDYTFPEAATGEFRAALDELSPGYTICDQPTRLDAEEDDAVLDELVQMNIGEIRTRIHQLLLAPVIQAHAQTDKDKLRRILKSILHDETRHIWYTAELIDEAMSSEHREFVLRIMERRLEEFNDITLQEVGLPHFE